MIGIKKHYIKIVLALLFVTFSAFATQADDEQDKAGLPVPRFVSLRSGDVNLRVGPGTRYSINWVYKRENLPVEIIQEFDQWREIRDADGTTGWVHKQMLQGRRYALIRGGVGILHHAANVDSSAVLKAEAGVIGHLLSCEKDWCRMQISGRKGWIEKKHMFGAYPKEEF